MPAPPQPRTPPRARAPRAPAFALHAEAGTAPGTERALTRAAWALAAALLIALLALALGPHRVGDYMTETDFYGGYAEGARALQHGRLDFARYGVVGPGYEVALALVGIVVRDLLLAAELIAALATVATLLLWFDLLRRRAGAALGLAAAAFLATNAVLVRYGWAATTDAFALALGSLALWLLLARGGRRAVVAAGVVAGAAFLTRYNAIALLPAGLLACALGETRTAGRAGAALRFTAGFLAVAAPWIGAAALAGGAPGAQLHHNLAYEVFARARGIPWDEYQRVLEPQFPTLAHVLARDPGAVLARLAANVVEHLRLDAARLATWPVAATAALGLLLAWRDGTLRALRGVLVAEALLFLSLVPAFHSERYALAILPGWAALAGAAVASPRFALVVRGASLKRALALVPLALALVTTVRAQARALDQLPIEILDAAATLRAHAQPGDRVIARKPHLAYHAGLAPVAFPFADSLGALADHARASGARWLWFSWPEAETRPRFFHLLDTAGVVPGLAVRHVTSPHPGVLYEIGPDFGRAPGWYDDPRAVLYHGTRARLLVDGADGPALLTLGTLERARGENARATALLVRAAQRLPDDLRVWLALGDAALAAGDRALGERAYGRAAALDPSSAEAQAGLGWAALVGGDVAGAAARWRPVVDRVSDPATLARMVDVFRARGDAAAAARAAARRAALAETR